MRIVSSLKISGMGGAGMVQGRRGRHTGSKGIHLSVLVHAHPNLGPSIFRVPV